MAREFGDLEHWDEGDSGESEAIEVNHYHHPVAAEEAPARARLGPVAAVALWSLQYAAYLALAGLIHGATARHLWGLLVAPAWGVGPGPLAPWAALALTANLFLGLEASEAAGDLERRGIRLLIAPLIAIGLGLLLRLAA